MDIRGSIIASVRRVRCGTCGCTPANYEKGKPCGNCKTKNWKLAYIDVYPMDIMVDMGVVN